MVDVNINIENIDISQNAISFSAGIILTVIAIMSILKHRETVERWLSFFYWALTKVWKGAEYLAIKAEIQGKINSFVSSLEANTTIQFPRIAVEWTGKEKQEELVWENDKIIIVMRDRKHKNKNFVHAAYFFTSEALLRKSKKHLTKEQKTSLDLFTTQKILSTENKAALEQFMVDYFSPYIEMHNDARVLIQQYLDIDKIGIFFPVLIQELSYLGSKVFLSKPTMEVAKEVKRLIVFLERFSQREIGDMTTPDSFAGKYMRCAIKIVATRLTRELGNITSQKERIVSAFNLGFENIYVIGSAQEENVDFIGNVAKSVLKERKYIQNIKTTTLKGQIRLGERIIKMNTYFVHLHNPRAVKHLYEQNDIERLV